MNEFAQLPTPTMATRTLSCCRSRFSAMSICLHQLLADVQDALDDRDPRRAGEEHERPGKDAPRWEHEPGGDDDAALGARADPDVAAETEGLRLRAGVRDENRSGDARDRDGDEDRLVVFC